MAVLTQKLDGILAALAGRQHGVVYREQLLAAGFTRHQVSARIASGNLIPLYPGVYLVAHTACSPLAQACAAVIACRPRALLGRRTACALWKLPVEAPRGIDIVVVGRGRRSLKGIAVRSIDHLAPGELRRIEGIPFASPSLALLDVAADLSQNELTAALHEARVQRIVSDGQLRSTLAAHPNRRGAHSLGALLEAEGAAKVTRSEAERLALRLMRKHGLDPESDVRIGRYRVDFLFRAEKLIVEVDGFRFHATPERFVADRRRTAALIGMGYVVFPLSWSDLTEGAVRAVTRLDAALEERRRRI